MNMNVAWTSNSSLKGLIFGPPDLWVTSAAEASAQRKHREEEESKQKETSCSVRLAGHLVGLLLWLVLVQEFPLGVWDLAAGKHTADIQTAVSEVC